jgi:hypothetical protein
MEFSMEFHGIFCGISWKFFMKKKSNVYENFHGIPWKIPEFHGIAWNFPWNSMEFHETEVDGKFHGIPWNSVSTGLNHEGSYSYMYFASIHSTNDSTHQ